MTEYTPTTEQVRSHYVFDQSDLWDSQRGLAFDRWLREHDAKVWDEGFMRAHLQHADEDARLSRRTPAIANDNPYGGGA